MLYDPCRFGRSLPAKIIQRMLEQRSGEANFQLRPPDENVAVRGSIFILRAGNARVGLPEKNALADQVFVGSGPLAGAASTPKTGVDRSFSSLKALLNACLWMNFYLAAAVIRNARGTGILQEH